MQTDEKQVKESAAQFHSLSNNLPGMMTYQLVREHDGSMKFIYVSDSVRDLTGRSVTEVLKDPGILYNLITEEDRCRIAKAEEKSWKNLSVFDIEVRSRNSRGELKWLHIRAVPKRLDDGRIMWDGVQIDITDRKKIEQQLAESEKNLRYVLSGIEDDFYAIDLDYKIIIINEAAQRYLEKSWGKPVKAGANILDLIPVNEKQRLMENFEKVFSGTKIERVVNNIAPGLPTWGFVSFMPVMDEHGKIIGANVTTRDISERKKNEEAIKESEERYRTLVENAPEALIVLDLLSEKFVNVSESATTLFKMSKNELLKKGLFEVSPQYQPDGRLSTEAVIEKLYEAVAGGKPSFEWMHIDSNGKLIPTEVRLVRLPSEHEILIRGSIIDIGERKKAERLLKESEEKYRNLVEQASDPIFIYSLDGGRILDHNNAFKTITGYSKKEIENLTLSDLLFPEQLATQPLGFGKIKKGIVVNDERTARIKNGSAIPFELRSKLMPNGNVMVIARDITERVKAGEAMKASEELKRSIMNSALDAIITMDTSGQVTSWNPQAAKIFGWSEKEIIGRQMSDLIIPKQYKDRHKKGMAHYVKTGETTVLNKLFEITAINKNKEEFPVELSIVPIKQGSEIIFCGFLRDISERKKAEQLLIESENRLRTIFNTEPECIKLLGPEGELLDINPAGLAFIEGDDLEMVKGQKVETIVGPAYREAFRQLTKDVFKGESRKLEFEITGLKGTKRWMSTHAVPLKDASEKIISVLSVTRDITQKRKAEEDLLKEKNLSDSIINSMPGIFYLYNENGKILRWNENLEVITGYTETELNDLHLFDFFEGEDLGKIKTKIKEVFEKGKAEIEAYAITKSKQKIPFYFTGLRIIYNEQPYLLGVGIDISERKKAEQEILIANERFNLISRATNDFVWDAYLAVNKVWWNDNYYTQLGWTKGLEIPEGSSWENHIHVSDKKRVLDRLNNIMMNSTESIWTDEYRFAKADGSYITVYDRGYIMRDDNGKAYRVIGAMTDISEIKKAEELLKKSYEDIRRLASHLEKIREEERLHIAREIHDELGQQLTVLKMDISWLSKHGSFAEVKAKQKISDLLQMIDKTIKTVRRISSDLRPSLLDDLGLLAALEWHSSEFEKRSGIKIKMVSEVHQLNIDTNIQTALFRVFQESLTNVARHSQATKVWVFISEKDGTLLIKIKDNGIGFDVLSIENKKTLGILGIKERVALLGGEYFIKSIPNQGTIVEIRVLISSIS